GGEPGEYPRGDGGAEDQLPVGDGLQRAADLATVGAFEEVAAGAGAHGREDGVVVVHHGEDEDSGLWPLGQNLAGRVDAVEDRHVQVHDHDVWLEGVGEVDDLLPVSGLADDLDVGHRADRGGQSLTVERVVV